MRSVSPGGASLGTACTTIHRPFLFRVSPTCEKSPPPTVVTTRLAPSSPIRNSKSPSRHKVVSTRTGSPACGLSPSHPKKRPSRITAGNLIKKLIRTILFVFFFKKKSYFFFSGNGNSKEKTPSVRPQASPSGPKPLRIPRLPDSERSSTSPPL